MGKFEPKQIGIIMVLLIMAIVSQSIESKKPSISDGNVSNQTNVQKSNQQVEGTGVTLLPSNVESVTIHSVVDGDTIKVHYNGNIETVRLLLIDSPESVHPSKPKQPFGVDASKYLKSLLKEGSEVHIEVGNPQRDSYGRLLAYIWIENELLNKNIVEFGYARVAYIYPPNIKYLDELYAAEETAKKLKIGIWSIEGYVTEEGFKDILK